MSCSDCLKRFHIAKVLMTEIPFPGDVLVSPPPRLMKFYNEVREKWDLYVAALGDAALHHDKDSQYPIRISNPDYHKIREKHDHQADEVKVLLKQGLKFRQIMTKLNIKSTATVQRLAIL